MDGDPSTSDDDVEIVESTSDEDGEDVDEELEADSVYANPTEGAAFVKVITAFLLLWQSVFKVSNSALEALLKFMKIILRYPPFSIVVNDNSKTLIPGSLLKAHRLLQLNRDDFCKLVVCPKCESTYKREECIDHCGTNALIKLCSHVEFPNHPWPNKRKPCSTPLLKHVKTSKGRDEFVPYKIYCYRSIIEALRKLVMSKQFVENCFAWRGRRVVNQAFCDVYDGRV